MSQHLHLERLCTYGLPLRSYDQLGSWSRDHLPPPTEPPPRPGPNRRPGLLRRVGRLSRLVAGTR
jgi:hypothetical protein